jgi:hypothetical protein
MWLLPLCVAGAKIVVGETFPDILSFPRVATGKPTCRLDRLRVFRARHAPWCSARAIATDTVDTLSLLRSTVLHESAVFNASRRHCAGDPRLMPSTDGPEGFCVYSGPPRVRVPTPLFDQYNLEIVLLTRWLQEAPICPDAPASAGGSCGADVVVVPSLVFHHTAAVGRSWDFSYCMTKQLMREYMRRVVGRYYEAGKPGPMLVLTESYAWDQRIARFLVREISKLPAELRARIVLLSTLSNVDNGLRARLAPPSSPWEAGGEVELSRR